uniref:Uncharacterized protein n=1 Tax=Rhizophora mucronata TaxID=61149 RepID=A0A2P2NXW8_RHIMU
MTINTKKQLQLEVLPIWTKHPRELGHEAFKEI